MAILSEKTTEYARLICNSVGLAASLRFERAFSREMRRLSRTSADEEAVSELANAVFIEIVEGTQKSSPTEETLLRALWRISKRWRREAKRYSSLTEECVPTAPSTAGGLDSRDLAEQVFAFLDELPAEAGLLVLNLMDGLGVADAALEARVSRATAYRWLRRLRSRLLDRNESRRSKNDLATRRHEAKPSD